MNLEMLCRDSLAMHSMKYPQLAQNYEVFHEQVKSYAKLKSYYDIAPIEEFTKEEYQKYIHIQESLHQQEKWFTQEIYSVLDVLSTQVRIAKNMSDYRGIVTDGIKMQQLFAYVSPSQVIQDKYERVMMDCEQSIEHFDIQKSSSFLTLPSVSLPSISYSKEQQKRHVKMASSFALGTLQVAGTITYEGLKLAGEGLYATGTVMSFLGKKAGKFIVGPGKFILGAGVVLSSLYYVGKGVGNLLSSLNWSSPQTEINASPSIQKSPYISRIKNIEPLEKTLQAVPLQPLATTYSPFPADSSTTYQESKILPLIAPSPELSQEIAQQVQSYQKPTMLSKKEERQLRREERKQEREQRRLEKKR